MPKRSQTSEAWQPAEEDIEEMCRWIYNEPGGARWDYMKNVSANLRDVTRVQAIRILTNLHEREESGGLL
jgi:hypothetical protein